MKFPDIDEQRRLVRQWAETGRELDAMRKKALRGMPYNVEQVDALLPLAEHYDGPPRFGEGEVEMQYYFMKHPKHPKSAAHKQDAGNDPTDRK